MLQDIKNVERLLGRLRSESLLLSEFLKTFLEVNLLQAGSWRRSYGHCFHNLLTTARKEDTFLHDFVVILKRMLQNYYKIVKKCLLLIMKIVDHQRMIEWNISSRLRRMIEWNISSRLRGNYCNLCVYEILHFLHTVLISKQCLVTQVTNFHL